MAAVNNNSSAHPSCSKTAAIAPAPAASRYCLCAPTTHPGSFRCRLHRPRAAAAATAPSGPDQAISMEAAAAAAAEEEEEEEEKKKEKEKETAAAARALLARVAGKPRQDVGRVKAFQPRSSRLRIMDG